MNVKELIEKIGNLDKLYGETFYVALDDVLDLVKQLDEPQPVKVKQFVADWYERNKNNLDYNIWEYIYNWDDQEESEFKNWFNCSKKEFQTLVNMHQFGYEVDEEKRYLVKIKASGQYIMNNPDENAVFFYSSRAYSKLTRKELEEAGFGWVFNCEGVEIEEVVG